MNDSQTKSWLTSDAGVLIVSVALLLVALVESFLVPWAPFFPVFAVIALALPLVLKTYSFGKFGKVMIGFLPFILLFLALSVLWDQISSGVILQLFLNALGVAGNPVYSLPAGIDAIFGAVTARTSLSLDAAQLVFAVFVLIWAPIGEELFYRGYVYGSFRVRHGFWTATLSSSTLFGVRHMLPFLILLPQLLIIPALTWFLVAFGFGVLSCAIYEKTGSLYPSVIVHFLVNVAGMIVMLFSIRL